MHIPYFKQLLLGAGASTFLFGSLVPVALAGGPQETNYGPGAEYQVELSANIPGPSGGGVWFWFALYPDGTADYSGSDCGHGGEGAAADKGDTTWHYINGDTQIEIDNVLLEGLGGFPSTITVPADYGHYKGDANDFFTLPFTIPDGVGFSELQVAL